MQTAFRPVAGQVVMVEVGGDALTGVVMPGGTGPVTIDIGPASSRPLQSPARVVVSVFSADAMYKLHATAMPCGTGLVSLDIDDVERVQRRASSRRPVKLGVTLIVADESDDEVLRVFGRSVDVGAGGVQVETARPLPRRAEPVVIMTIPGGTSLMVTTRVVAAVETNRGCHYRLAFTNLAPSDADRLAVVMGAD